MTEENIWITNRFGEKLEALVRKPPGNGPLPAVLFVSGFSMDLHEYRNSNDEITKLLVEEGFMTLQFSLAGRGKSEGDYIQMTIERQARQVEDMIKWLVNQPNIDTNRIGIFAQSFGCPTTLLTNLNQVKSICLNCGVYFLNDKFKDALIKDYADSYLDSAGNIVFVNESGEKSTVSQNFWKTNQQFDPLRAAQKINIPVFMTHGDKDIYTQTTDFEKVFAAFPQNNKKLKNYKDGEHGISADSPAEVRQEFLSDVVKWFNQTLK